MGKHLILDIKCQDRVLMEDKEFIKNLLNECVEKVNMNKLIEPIVLEGAPHNRGVTGFVIIETSHISIHTFSDRNKITFDLYSCVDYKKDLVREYISSKIPNSEIINETWIERDDY